MRFRHARMSAKESYPYAIRLHPVRNRRRTKALHQCALARREPARFAPRVRRTSEGLHSFIICLTSRSSCLIESARFSHIEHLPNSDLGRIRATAVPRPRDANLLESEALCPALEPAVATFGTVGGKKNAITKFGLTGRIPISFGSVHIGPSER